MPPTSRGSSPASTGFAGASSIRRTTHGANIRTSPGTACTFSKNASRLRESPRRSVPGPRRWRQRTPTSVISGRAARRSPSVFEWYSPSFCRTSPVCRADRPLTRGEPDRPTSSHGARRTCSGARREEGVDTAWYQVLRVTIDRSRAR
jgi:hypothetical protein